MRQDKILENRVGERRISDRRGIDRRRGNDRAWIASGQPDQRSGLERRAVVPWRADRRQVERRGASKLN
jgi:hypothetical protein